MCFLIKIINILYVIYKLDFRIFHVNNDTYLLIQGNQTIANAYYARETTFGPYLGMLFFRLVKQIIKTTYWWRSVLSAVRVAASANCVQNRVVNTCPTKIVILQIKGGMITDVEKDWLTSGDLKDHIMEYLSLPYIKYSVDIDIETFDNFKAFEDYFNTNIVPFSGYRPFLEHSI